MEVRLRQNCVVGIPKETTSCSVATTNLADRVANAVHKAMAAIGEGLGMAESGAIEGPAGAVISGRDARHGSRTYINQLALAGTAGGASPRADGWLTLGNVCTAGMWTMDSVEIDEVNYPLRVEERMLLPDSEGAGRYRGASCCRVVYQPTAGDMRLHYACDGAVNAARGVNGGGDGGPARQWIRRRDGSTAALPGIGDLVVEAGERIIAHSTGGGGFGDPRSRPVEAVCADVRAGLVSPEARPRSVCRVSAMNGESSSTKRPRYCGATVKSALFLRQGRVDVEGTWYRDDGNRSRGGRGMRRHRIQGPTRTARRDEGGGAWNEAGSGGRGYGYEVTETEVEEVLLRPGEDRPGRDGSRVVVGRTSGGKCLRVIYIPDPEPASVFVVTAYELTGKPLSAFRRRMRRRGQLSNRDFRRVGTRNGFPSY